MNINNIRSLAKIMCDANLSTLEYAEGDIKIKLEKKEAVMMQAERVVTNTYEKAILPEPVLQDEGVVNFNNMKEIKSPMVGVFYACPSPEAEPFIKIGSKVKKGDVLCIIEAMKLMNEITAETDGEIIDVCVSSGQVVEYSQTLFKIF